ncbi:MAG: amidohydrolase [Bacteroidetes bacterium]|nr:amidohydrolase [Bacteroidota bacterium]
MKLFISIITVMALFTSCTEEKTETADLILINGKIITVDESLPEAEAIAVKGDTIWAIGTSHEIEKLSGSETKVIDLNGAYAYPGFIESHAHFLGLGNAKLNLDLTKAKNWDEVIFQVAEAVHNVQPGQWIIGRGWHQEKWDPVPQPNVEGYPVHTILSQASPYNPVMLTHASGHAIFANAKAMELAGIDTSTPDPEGGKIVRDSLGYAVGVFEETAEDLISVKLYEYLNSRTEDIIKNEKLSKIKLASEECLSKGITSFHDAGESFEDIDLFKELAGKSHLDVRLYVMIGESNQELKKKINDYKMIGYGNNYLTVRAIKKYMDGALGSRGAWMIEPYDDLSEHSGLNVTPINELKETAKIAAENGFQLCTHAIGDRGNKEVLDLYENVLKKYSDQKDMRWRIEHAQHLSNEDISRFFNLGVIAAMQAVHCTSDASFVPKRIGNIRAEEGAYVWRKLIDSGATICNGTDAPVEDVNPIQNFYASVTRKLIDGTEFYAGQKMSRMEALLSYTKNGAYAAFEENTKGSLSTGKLADITVLSNNLLTCSEEEILNTNVLYTIVGGKIKYQSSFASADR